MGDKGLHNNPACCTLNSPSPPLLCSTYTCSFAVPQTWQVCSCFSALQVFPLGLECSFPIGPQGSFLHLFQIFIQMSLFHSWPPWSHYFIFSLFLSLSTSLSLFFILELIFLSYLSTLISFLSHRSLMDLFLFSKSVFKKSFFVLTSSGILCLRLFLWHI